MYTLAAHWEFEELVVSSSRYALRMDSDAQCITDDHALSKAKLKELLLMVPTLHDKDTLACTLRDRLSVQRAYGLAAGYSNWEKAASMAGEEIRYAPRVLDPPCLGAVISDEGYYLRLFMLYEKLKESFSLICEYEIA